MEWGWGCGLDTKSGTGSSGRQVKVRDFSMVCGLLAGMGWTWLKRLGAWPRLVG